MGLKYVLNAMRRRKLRTVIVQLALIVGVALVGALLMLVDTQRQFAVQAIGQQTGGFDLSIRRADTASSPFFDPAASRNLAQTLSTEIVSVLPRIQGEAEGRALDATQGESISIVGLDAARDTLNAITVSRGAYPPGPGQVFLTVSAADLLRVGVGDSVQLSYVRPAPRQSGRAAVTGTSSVRARGTFIVSGIGIVGGLGNTVFSGPFAQAGGDYALLRIEDAQAWLGEPGKVERLLFVWNSDTEAGVDAKAAVSRARDQAVRMRDALAANLGADYLVEVPKYRQLDLTQQAFVFQQTFITLYGLLSMGIVGLMVNALMMTAVQEQKFDLAVLRVLGSPRNRLYEAVVVEVILLGVVGVVIGLGLGRLINDAITTPILLAALQLPQGVRPEWTLRAVLTPTAITAAVLALATISPARTAANAKVMVVLNPAAADQPTLEELSRLRERQANYGLLAAGVILLAFCSMVVFVFPLLFSLGDLSAVATIYFIAFLLMVIGMSLVFLFVATPLERILVKIVMLFSPALGFFIGSYALRGKGRNSLISLMVVVSAVLPCLLAAQLALTDANIETDSRFNRGADAIARPGTATTIGGVFRSVSRSSTRLSDDNLRELAAQPGIANAAAVATDYRGDASDRAQVRVATVTVIGVQGDLSAVLVPGFYQFASGDERALRRLATERDVAVISAGLSDLLDLKQGDQLRLRGSGFDHETIVTIIAVGARIPGFNSEITRNRNNAQQGQTGVLVNIDMYRALRWDPARGSVDVTEALYNRVLMRADRSVAGYSDEGLSRALRDVFSGQKGIAIEVTAETVRAIRAELERGRIFTVLLTGLSMVTAVFGVLAVMYTAVMGRRVEIGMLKAIGGSRRTLRSIFIGEAIVTTLAAALAGIIAGTILGYIFEYGQRFSQETPLIWAFDAGTAALICIMVTLAAILSAALATQPVIVQKAVRILRDR
ncbi:MAG: FtsX-like permease family protein [Thermoflexales bacterium]|nr:FtsX-like permease family protein [Thermoflexales bacterium]